MLKRQPSFTSIAGILLLLAMLFLCIENAATIQQALLLMQRVLPGTIAVALLAIGAGFLCAGQIYGRILALPGYRLRQVWLAAAALVSILISQSIPAGTVGSYAFLATMLRRRGIPATSAVLLASLEVLTWMGAMLLLFCFALLYLTLTIGGSGGTLTVIPAATTALLLLSIAVYIARQPQATLCVWAMRAKHLLERLIQPCWSDAAVQQFIADLVRHRAHLLQQPAHIASLIGLQLVIFGLHSLALLSILYSLDVTISPMAVIAAYGITLIVSSFTILPGGGGAVETTLAVALSIQGVSIEIAVGAAVLFRLLSFWLLLPLGFVCYRWLLLENQSARQ